MKPGNLPLVVPDADTDADRLLDDLWDRGERPEVRSFVDSCATRRLEGYDLLAVLRVDQRRRWLAGQRVGPERYRLDFPDLVEDPEALFELIYHEILIREELGESPSAEEYARAYPEFAGRLRLQLEVHEALSDDGTPPDEEERDERDEPSRAVPRIPGYEVLGEIGRGGMGVVYRAQQGRPQRTVALKMILEGRFASAHDLLRFQNETEAVAALDHPNIVPILEVGQYDNLHYFTMRLQTGGNLAERLADFRGDYRRVAGLVAEVAGAVHHAHQRGILHRDLKPANILLDEVGKPYVTDFGLAKRVQGREGITAPGAFLGSPAYMAPEQASGDPTAITTAADVYGLGAILYALLTGQSPFPGDSVHETLARLHGQAPEAPSRIDRSVPRPLEVICLKCLEKDPTRRYGSARALGEDLGRWLRDEPIEARRASAWTRTRLWVRRRPTQAALALALVASMVVGIGAGLTLWLRAERKGEEARLRLADVLIERQKLHDTIDELERMRAREREERRKALDRFGLALQAVENTFGGTGDGSILRMPGGDAARKKALQRTIDLYTKLQAAIEADPSPEARTQLAISYAKLADMSAEVGSAEIPLSAAKKTVSIRRELLRMEPEQFRRRMDLINSLQRLGAMELRFNRVEDALKSFQGARDSLDELRHGYPDKEEEALASITLNLWYLGSVHFFRGRLLEGLRVREQAVEIQEGLLRKDPKKTRNRSNHASSLWNLGGAQQSVGRLAEAARSLERASEEMEALHRESPGDNFFNVRLLDCIEGLAGVYQAQGRLADTVRTREWACRVAEVLTSRHPEIPRNLERQSIAFASLSECKVEAGTDGTGELSRSIDVLETLVRTYPAVDRYRRSLGLGYLNRARMARQAGDLASAESSARRAIAEFRSVAHGPPNEDPLADMAIGRIVLALVLLDRGRAGEAAPLVTAAGLALQAGSRTPALTRYDLGCALARLGAASEIPQVREMFADMSMAQLRRAAAEGLRGSSLYGEDRDLASLRTRRDFPIFVRDLTFPSDPFAR